MIAALADAGAALGEPRYLDAAVACARVRAARAMRDGDGRLLRTLQRRRGARSRLPRGPRVPARGAARAVRSDLRGALVREARALADELIERFADPERGGFFSTAADGEALIARRKDLEDTPIPSGSSSAALGLLRLAQLTGEARYERHAASVRAALAARDRRRATRRLRAPAAGAALAPRRRRDRSPARCRSGEHATGGHARTVGRRSCAASQDRAGSGPAPSCVTCTR